MEKELGLELTMDGMELTIVRLNLYKIFYIITYIVFFVRCVYNLYQLWSVPPTTLR